MSALAKNEKKKSKLNIKKSGFHLYLKLKHISRDFPCDERTLMGITTIYLS